MPTYDYKCNRCGGVFENIRAGVNEDKFACRGCLGFMRRVFTPTANILIPNAFKAVTQGFNSGGRGEDSAPYSDNNSVHSPRRQSFTEAFDANYKKAGGIG